MISFEHFRTLALSFPEATEDTHFEKTSFKVKKKIFATYDAAGNRACVKLSEIDQDVFTSTNKHVIFPVSNSWGKQGWTLIDLSKVRREVLEDALATAYCQVAPKPLAALVRPDSPDTP